MIDREPLAIEGGHPASSSMIGYGHQVISDKDIYNVMNILKSDYLTCGPATIEFEQKIKKTTGAGFATAVANGTAALHIAMLAAGVRAGDEVIVSPITFAASANCILYVGATPVFADIDQDTWNIDPESIEKKITSKTKAVIAVDFGGVPVDADAISSICRKNGLLFIEDAAHSLGSVYKNKPVGSIADITTLSFHPVKTITTGEGGAVLTNDPNLHKMIQLYAKHGITREKDLMHNQNCGDWYYEQLVLGYNYRISDIQAALGISQLDSLDQFAKRRREIVHTYNKEFKTLEEINFQLDPCPDDTVRHLYCIRFDLQKCEVGRRQLFDALKAENIGVNVHYIPVYRLPYYESLGYEAGLCPNAESYYESAITLPLHCGMSDSDVAAVIKAVQKVTARYCRNK